MGASGRRMSGLAVSHRKTNVVVFSKAAAKVSGCEGDRGGGLIHLPLAGEVNPRVGLLVEAEDLYGG
jgi:hypothetical protein